MNTRKFKTLLRSLLRLTIGIYLSTLLFNFLFGTLITVLPILPNTISFTGHSSRFSRLPLTGLEYDTDEVKFISFETINHLYDHRLLLKEDLNENFKGINPKDAFINWNEYAYVQYATDLNYLCSAIINFHNLRDNTEAELVILYTSNLLGKKDSTDELRLIRKAQGLGIILKQVSEVDVKSSSTAWSKSFTKFHVFNQSQYKRIIYFDSDSSILHPMDELFFIPPCGIALPVSYDKFRTFDSFKIDLADDIPTWEERNDLIKDLYLGYIESQSPLDPSYYINLYDALPSMKSTIELLNDSHLKYQLGSYIMVIEPSSKVFNDLMTMVDSKTADDYDMDILNKYIDLSTIINNRNYIEEEKLDRKTNELKVSYKPLVMIIPHQPYGLLSGELRYGDQALHECYLADPQDLPLLASLPRQTRDSMRENPDQAKPYWSWTNLKLATGYGWNIKRGIAGETKLVHFSDYPLPKPWSNIVVGGKEQGIMDEHRITCKKKEPNSRKIEVDCLAVETWEGWYEQYALDRMNICELDLI